MPPNPIESISIFAFNAGAVENSIVLDAILTTYVAGNCFMPSTYTITDLDSRIF